MRSFLLFVVFSSHDVFIIADEWANFRGRILCDFYEPPPPLGGFDPSKDPRCCKPLVDESLLIDEKSRGLKNAVVWLASNPTRVHPQFLNNGRGTVAFDAVECRYSPRIVVAQVGQTFAINNADQTTHNPVFHPPNNALMPNSILLEAKRGRLEQQVARRTLSPFYVSCNIHPWMKAYCLCVDNPYFGVTGNDGKFEVRGLPTYEHLEFRIWHERFGWITPDGGQNLATWKATLGPAEKQLPDIRLTKANLRN